MGEFISQDLYQAALSSFNRTVLVNGLIVFIAFILGFFLSKWSLQKTEKLPKDSGKVDVAKIVNIRWSGIAGTTMIVAGIVISVMTMNSKPVYSVASKDGETNFTLAALNKQLTDIHESVSAMQSNLYSIENSSLLAKISENNEKLKTLEKSFYSFNKWTVEITAALTAKKDKEIISVLTRALEDDDRLVRVNTASALTKIGPPAKLALPALQKQLNKNYPEGEIETYRNAIREIERLPRRTRR